MYEEILDEKQVNLLPLISKFSSQFGLVGGTAIALHLGHRRSIDFDLFSNIDLDIEKIKSVIRKTNKIELVSIESPNELTMFVDGVKITFLKYPFKFDFDIPFKKYINIPDLLALSIMKAHALGRRAKWKDYVDLYFILQRIKLTEISKGATEVFLGEFNGKLFREQLSYFEGIDYSEQVEYMEGFEVSDEKVKKFLIDISLQK